MRLRHLIWIVPVSAVGVVDPVPHEVTFTTGRPSGYAVAC